MQENTSTTGNLAQPAIVARGAAILRRDGLVFKDLNGNGQLDPYKDWRRPVEERVEDLLARMTLEEKAGLMVHPALGMAEGGALLEEPQTLEISPGVRMAMGPATTGPSWTFSLAASRRPASCPSSCLRRWKQSRRKKKMCRMIQ